MADDPRYINWVRVQDCAACGGPGPCEAHHALSGLTYSPDEPIPAKAIPNARKGKSQKSHDHYAFALHLRCHAQLHRGTGPWSDKTPEERDAWERDCVARSRARYAMTNPVPAARSESARPRQPKPELAGWTVGRVLALLRREAAQSHRSPDAAAALNDVADLVEGRAF